MNIFIQYAGKYTICYNFNKQKFKKIKDDFLIPKFFVPDKKNYTCINIVPASEDNWFSE